MACSPFLHLPVARMLATDRHVAAEMTGQRARGTGSKHREETLFLQTATLLNSRFEADTSDDLASPPIHARRTDKTT